MTVDETGRTHLRFIGEGPELARFHAVLRDEAAKLAALGDASPLETRLARALGVIADRQQAMDLSATSQPTWWRTVGR